MSGEIAFQGKKLPVFPVYGVAAGNAGGYMQEKNG